MIKLGTDHVCTRLTKATCTDRPEIFKGLPSKATSLCALRNLVLATCRYARGYRRCDENLSRFYRRCI